MLTIKYQPFPVLESERLVLRQLTDADTSAVFRIRSNAARMQYIPRPILETEAQALEMITLMNQKVAENTDINWAVCEKVTGTFIGFMGFYRTQPEHYRTEIGYMVAPEFDGKGYVTEAVKTMLTFAFHQVGFHSVCAVIDPNNIASGRVLEKNGFRKEAHFIEDFYWNGRFIDSVHYGLLKKEFISSL